VTLKVIQAHWW